MSIGMILHLLAQDRTMLIEALLGNILICIVVYTLFGKRKYDWFFPIACAVRYIFYNIGLLSIWNAMYGTQNWYKITMSTCATATALILVIITAILWKEPLSKVMVGVFSAECINDGILYQVADDVGNMYRVSGDQRGFHFIVRMDGNLFIGRNIDQPD